MGYQVNFSKATQFRIWATQTLKDKFLNFNEYRVLEGKGTISKIAADKKAVEEYEVFNKTQKIISDFDKEIKKLTSKNKKN